MRELGIGRTEGFLRIVGVNGQVDLDVSSLEMEDSTVTNFGGDFASRFIALPNDAPYIGYPLPNHPSVSSNSYKELLGKEGVRVFDPGENPLSYRDFYLGNRLGTRSWDEATDPASQEIYAKENAQIPLLTDLCTTRESILQFSASYFPTPIVVTAPQSYLFASNKDSGGGFFVEKQLVANIWGESSDEAFKYLVYGLVFE
ncbi:MAG: hypothetical protein F9K27_17395 [Anaerolineae bacterium]|nr:MAG: hypothetical protein F9K27_17395 [Anaerolineae bacterium]